MLLQNFSTSSMVGGSLTSIFFFPSSLVVYHGNYANYYEMSRTDAIRKLGLPYKNLEDEGVMLPILEIHSKFLAPAVYDEVLTIRSIMRIMPLVKWTVDAEIYNEANILIHQATVTLVFMDKNTRRACRAPQKVLDMMRPFFATN